ncbi:flagellar motor switch protein [Caballeronia pedi]|uniref:Flagellar motor switch protein FliN n=1 Tax=Caballeronia pedi TaxID=1777141 RepID=A0A158C1X8_9BURK|nr:FliM/FliN family flagellar motor switch protein [Caballeronia pedi]SAK75896.1 flagellar motor switch protein [Caballeronia pedi]
MTKQLEARQSATPNATALETTLVHDAPLPVLDHGAVDPASTPSRSNALDLVGDVEVRLEARLGAALTSIERLMNFAPGTVVELDRHLEDAVEITLNSRPIARGTIVAVGENFGVRISEILDTTHGDI